MEQLRKWFDNIWYHYKVPILLVAALIVIAVVLISSSVSKPKVDMQVLYLTEHPVVYPEKNAALASAISAYAEDLNGDGKVIVTVQNLHFGAGYAKDVIQSNRMTFATQMMTGDCMLIAADAYGLTYAATTNFLGTLTDLTDQTVCDGYGWDAKDSMLLKSAYMTVWDGDLYFALRGYTDDSVTDRFSDSEKRYEAAKETLRRIMSDSSDGKE